MIALSEAIQFALQNNPRLRAASAAVARARSGEAIAFAPFLPQVDLLARYGGTSGNLSPGAPGLTGSILGTGEVPPTFGQAELQLQYVLCDFGRTAGRYRQAVSRERMAALQFARARETVAFDVALAYLQGLLAEAVRVVQEEAIRRAEATLRDTRARRAAGVADRDDVLRAEVQLSEAREALVVAREAALAALARLNTVMGRNASLPLVLLDPGSPTALSLSLVQCLEIAAGQRQEIGVAREAVATAQLGRSVAEAEFWSRLYVRGSLGYVSGDNIETGWQEGAGIHLDQPLYAGGRRQGQLRGAEAELAEAAANAQTILDGVTLEVTLAHRSVATARVRIDLSRPAVAEARENLRLVREKYRNGTATPTDIVDAETTLTRAQQRFWSATYDYLAALARLDYAMGTPQGSLIQPSAAVRTEIAPPPRPAGRPE